MLQEGMHYSRVTHVDAHVRALLGICSTVLAYLTSIRPVEEFGTTGVLENCHQLHKDLR